MLVTVMSGAALVISLIPSGLLRRQSNKLRAQAKLDTAHLAVLATTLAATGKSLDASRKAGKEVMELFIIRTSEVNDLKEEVGRLERELAQQEELIHVLQASTPVRDSLGRFSSISASGLLDGIFGDGEINDDRGSDRKSGQASLSAGRCC